MAIKNHNGSTFSVGIGGVTGLGSNVAAFLADPTSAKFAAALTDETGFSSGAVAVFSISPTLTGLVNIAGSGMSGSSATSNFLNVTGTMPSSLSATTSAALFSITTAGSSNQEVAGLIVNLNAGYTGANYSVGLEINNAVAGVGASGLTLSTANYGNTNAATATTSGHNVGAVGLALGGNVNIGAGGRANAAKNSATNIGVYGLALNTGTSPIQIGGLFYLGTTAPGTLTSAALMCDSGSTTSDIFVARDNGNPVMTIADGGTTTFTGSVAIGSGTAITKVLSATATLDFADTAAQNSTDLTIAVTGAAVGDTVAIGLPAAPAANTSFSGWVSAADTVTIRFNNYSSGNVNPASATYRATVIKF